MNAITSAMASAVAPVRARWTALAPREQSLVTGAAAVVLLALLWWVAVAPALRTLQGAETQRRTLEVQWQTMQNLLVQARLLQAQPGVNQSDALRALESSVKQSLGASAQLTVVGDRATVTVRAVSAEALAQWLAQARINARALPSEARLVRASAPTPVSPPTTPTAPGAAVVARPAGTDEMGAFWSGSMVLSLPPS